MRRPRVGSPGGGRLGPWDTQPPPTRARPRFSLSGRLGPRGRRRPRVQAAHRPRPPSPSCTPTAGRAFPPRGAGRPPQQLSQPCHHSRSTRITHCAQLRCSSQKKKKNPTKNKPNGLRLPLPLRGSGGSPAPHARRPQEPVSRHDPGVPPPPLRRPPARRLGRGRGRGGEKGSRGWGGEEGLERENPPPAP